MTPPRLTPAEVRRAVAEARLAATLMRPSGYARDALRYDEEYMRGANNVADAVLNMIEPKEAEPAKETT